MEKIKVQIGATITEFDVPYAIARSIITVLKKTDCIYSESHDEELLEKWSKENVIKLD